MSLPTKLHLHKAMVFPVVIYGFESWTIKKAEHQRIDVFELWCWRRLLRVPWTARRSNQSILKEISPGCSLEGLMLKLKTPILWPPDVKSWLIWKDPDAGKDWRQREKGWQRMRWLDGITDLMESEKGDLKINIQKTKIMGSSSMRSWQIDGKNNGNSDRLYFGELQNHCRWWLQPWD